MANSTSNTMSSSRLSSGSSSATLTANSRTSSESVSMLHLRDIPTNVSLSFYLSPEGIEITAEGPVIISTTHTLNSSTKIDRPISDCHLILLALNEECRRLRRGGFYHLPLRDGTSRGHPCDMVFVDERWGDKGNMKWDAASWQERLEMCAAEGKIKDSELVIPICTRILRHNMPGMPLRQKGCGEVYPHPSDQAVSRYPDKIAWSRGIEDTSRILLLYPHHHANPILWPTDVAENSECSVHVTTPNDLSEAHIAKGQKYPRFSSDYWNATGTESPDRLPGPVQGNRDVVGNLLRIWNQTDFKQEDVMVALDWTIFVNVKDTWDFVKKQADSLDAESRKAMLAFWPKEWPDE